MTDKEKYMALGGVIDHEEIVDDSGCSYGTDYHYLLMNRWAFMSIMEQRPRKVIDFGSHLGFLTMLSTMFPVDHYDIRKPCFECGNMNFKIGDVTRIDLPENYAECLTCLHVAEHVGLGRYGDEIDPSGFNKACSELQRVLAPGGVLYFAVPAGRRKTVFNKHRVLAYGDVIAAFQGLLEIEFSAIGSAGYVKRYSRKDYLDDCEYGCGLWRLRKQGGKNA